MITAYFKKVEIVLNQDFSGVAERLKQTDQMELRQFEGNK